MSIDIESQYQLLGELINLRFLRMFIVVGQFIGQTSQLVHQLGTSQVGPR